MRDRDPEETKTIADEPVKQPKPDATCKYPGRLTAHYARENTRKSLETRRPFPKILRQNRSRNR